MSDMFKKDSLWQDWLDEEICEFYSSIAASVNNDGEEEQMRTLIANGVFSLEEIQKAKKKIYDN